jgi:hypothetical protein
MRLCVAELSVVRPRPLVQRLREYEFEYECQFAPMLDFLQRRPCQHGKKILEQN